MPLTKTKVTHSKAKNPSVERLQNLVKIFNKTDRVLIVITADPDSIASALAMKRLLWRRVQGVTIAHNNEIKRLDNLAMIKLLNVPLQRLQTLAPEAFTRKVMLDSQPYHNPDFAHIDYDAVIDHHPAVEPVKASWIDIRPEYGATASIMFEYLRAARIKPSVRIATALFHAIKVDTENFTKRATSQDIAAFTRLFDQVNQALIRKMESSDIKLSDLAYFRLALDKMRYSRKRIYCHVGKVENPDILVLLADYFMRVYEIGWGIVSGFCGDKFIVIFRSDGYRKNAGKLAMQVFGAVGSAGGHRQSARAEIPRTNMPHSGREFSSRSLERLIVRHLKT